MDAAGLVIYASALLLASGTPGPGVATLVARVLGRGWAGGVPLALGLAVGDIIWLSAGIWGLAVLAQTFSGVFTALKWAGIAYLLYLAWRMWTTPVAPREVTADRRGESPVTLFMTGLAVCLGNPKVMAFYLALVPTLLDLHKVTVTGWLQLVAVTLACLTITFGGYITLAARARLLFTRPDTLRNMNRSASVAIAGTAVWMAAR